MQLSSKVKIIFTALMLSINLSLQGKDFIIYSITQDFPMGFENEVLNKNFYINMGETQGLKSGTTLDVYRKVSRLDPYTSKKMHNHKVKIGELEVIHVEEQTSITKLKKYSMNKSAIQFEIRKFMIGDKVKVNIK
ncbi:MAG: FlgT C-terminal domain-containing protein [Bacteriovoracaceae bacterium]